jgi:hypothetical protein
MSAFAKKHESGSRMRKQVHAGHRSGCDGERSCAAESLSATRMVGPQTGQFQSESGGSREGDVGEAGMVSEPLSSWEHIGNNCGRISPCTLRIICRKNRSCGSSPGTQRGNPENFVKER